MNIYKASRENFIKKYIHAFLTILLNNITSNSIHCKNMRFLNVNKLYEYTCLEKCILVRRCDRLRIRCEKNKTLLRLNEFYLRLIAIIPAIWYSYSVKLNLLGSTHIHGHYIGRTRERNPPALYDRLHVIEIHDRGISGSDRRTDISANTRLLAPIVPLYTTEIPSKMQEDTSRAGRNS